MVPILSEHGRLDIIPGLRLPIHLPLAIHELLLPGFLDERFLLRYPREVSTIETLNMTETDKDELLRILESRGQQFLSAFASPVVMSKRKDVSAEDTRRAKKRRTMNQSEEEWSGIGSSSESEDSGESESEGSGAGESASSGGLQGIALIDTL